MRIFYSRDFTGHYPVGTAAIVVAEDRTQAVELLSAKLNKLHLHFDGTLVEVLLENNPQAIILRDGDY